MQKEFFTKLLDLYFTGHGRLLDSSLVNLIENLKVNDKQKQVMKKLLDIPYGECISYSEFAENLGNRVGVRSIATLIGKNPLPVVVPCHRVIKKNGETGEFVFGTKIKQELIDFEAGRIKEVDSKTKELINRFYLNSNTSLFSHV